MAMENILKKIQQLLGAALPAGAASPRFARVQPSPDLAFYTAFVTFESSEDVFTDFVTQMQMDPPGTGDGLAFLPAAWRPAGAPAWWTAGPATPPQSAARQSPLGGWTVAKYENGTVYILKTETGINALRGAR
jgi:hypothetical protein